VVRIFWIVGTLIALGCARKVPPPGKGEFKGPKVILFSPEVGDTASDVLRLNLYAEDGSGLNSLSVERGNEVIFTIPLRGKNTTVDTTLILQRKGDMLLPDTLTIGVSDRWDNWTTLRVVVFAYREPPKDSTRNQEGGK